MRKYLTWPLLFVAALLLILEEYLWVKISDFLLKFSEIPVIRKVEGWVAKQNRWTMLALFGAPLCVSLPIKLFGFFLLARGDVISGFTLLALAEIIGTAIMARLFLITKPTLMSFYLFAQSYSYITAIKEWARNLITSSSAWQQLKLVGTVLKAFANKQKRTLISWRLGAAKRFLRRK